jgi:uncharacterized RDD family membrane protein YckC
MNGPFFCSQCGAPSVAGAQFCTRCGASTQPAAAPAPTPAAIPSPVAARSYQPPVAYPGTVPVGGVRYGGFWIRFVAAIIDGIIVQAVVFPISLLIGGVTGLAGAMSDIQNIGLRIMGGTISFVIGVAGSWLYEALMESSSRQATLGKMIFQMKVTDLSGNRISFARATGRYFAKWLSGLTLFIGYIIAGFTERKQALHDMVAGTLVRIGRSQKLEVRLQK